MTEIMRLIDMTMDAEEAREFTFPSVASAPKYPYGLCLSLCEKEIEKLGLDFDDICIGDLVHLHAMALVTSKSCSETEDGGQKCRIELQITHLNSEDEQTEDSDYEEHMKVSDKIKKLYK